MLVIEDDANTVALVALYLEREGFRTLTASDGRAGLDSAISHRPDLVILDLMLPGIDGWELCRRLRRHADIPVIMLTARGEEIDRVAGLTLGADDYVVKPFSPRELLARVQAVLRRARRAPEAALETFRAGFERKGIAVKITVPPGSLSIPADRNAMARVFRNLTDNALRYSPAGSAVTIEIVSSGGQILVANTNPAGELLEEALPFLFERFYRGEKSRSREHGGAGIGLSLVKELVEAHGGSVAAELSEGLVRIRLALPAPA